MNHLKKKKKKKKMAVMTYEEFSLPFIQFSELSAKCNLQRKRKN